MPKMKNRKPRMTVDEPEPIPLLTANLSAGVAEVIHNLLDGELKTIPRLREMVTAENESPEAVELAIQRIDFYEATVRQALLEIFVIDDPTYLKPTDSDSAAE